LNPARRREDDIEPCGRAAQHGAGARAEGEELRAPNGRLALLYDGFWVGQLGGGETTGRSGKATRKSYALLRVSGREGGGFNIEVERVLDKNRDKKILDELSLNKRIHHEKSLKLFSVPGKVRGDRCQLITL
jgi:hypothetical protein